MMNLYTFYRVNLLEWNILGEMEYKTEMECVDVFTSCSLRTSSQLLNIRIWVLSGPVDWGGRKLSYFLATTFPSFLKLIYGQ